MAGALVGSTSYDYRPTAFTNPKDGPLPKWTLPCRRDPPRGRPYLLACAHVKGRVVYVERRDADGDGDAHLVTVAGPRLVVLKLRAGGARPALPRVGETVDAAGTVTKDRGLTEIDVGVIDGRGVPGAVKQAPATGGLNRRGSRAGSGPPPPRP